jgi:hypothetical protein
MRVKMVRSQPLQWTMSEKTYGGTTGHTSTTRAASPDLWQVKSENDRWRQWHSATTTWVASVELGMDDEEAFRQVVKAFIMKQQTRFHC